MTGEDEMHVVSAEGETTRAETPTSHALKVLANCRIALGASFKTLAPDQLNPLRRWLSQDRYSPASHKLGSPLQSYHAKLQKDAKGR